MENNFNQVELNNKRDSEKHYKFAIKFEYIIVCVVSVIGLLVGIGSLIGGVIGVTREISDNIKFKNGKETTANIVEFVTNENTGIIDYFIKYAYLNELTGNENTGITKQSYSGDLYNKFFEEQIIQIKYLKNGKSIEISALEIKFNNVVIYSFMGLIGCFFIGVSITQFKKIKKKKQMLFNEIESQEYIAYYIGTKEFRRKGELTKCYIKFKYTDDYGNIQEKESFDYYSKHEAKYYETKGSFKIKTDGKIFLISEPVNYEQNTFNNLKSLDANSENNLNCEDINNQYK